MQTKKRYLYTIRNLYLIALTVYAIVREIIPLQPFDGFVKLGLELVAYAFFGGGLLLIAGLFLWDRDYRVKANVGLFIAFVAVCALSTLINFKYDFIANVKAIGWMGLYFFLLYPFGFHHAETKDKTLSRIFLSAFIVYVALVLLSLPMYFFNVEYAYAGGNLTGEFYTKGFHGEYLRLWGVFNDPNSAAAYAIVVIGMSVYLFSRYRALASRIAFVIGDLLLVIFLVLAGSRGAILAFVLACAWVAFYCVYQYVRVPKGKKVGASVLACILAGLIGYGGLVGVANVMPSVKKGVNELCGQSVSRSVHIAYDNAYKALGLNVVYGYYEEKDDVEGDGNDPEDSVGVGGRPDLEYKDDVSNGRFDKWLDAVEIFLCAPIFGASPRGASSFGKVHCPNNEIALLGAAAHNALFEVLMSTGALGILLILVIFLGTAIAVFQQLKKKFNAEFLLGSTLVLALLVYAMFVSDLFFIISFGGVSFWLAMGLVHGIRQTVDPDELPKENADGKKRILVYGLKDPAGGIEKIVYDYVKTITQDHPDVSFDFLQFAKPFSMEKQFTDLGCRMFYLPARGRKYFQYKRAMETIFSENRYVAVWGNYTGLTNIDLLVLAKKYHVPVRIAHSHNSRLAWGRPYMKYVVYGMHTYNKLWVDDYATDFWACSDVAGKYLFPKKTHGHLRMIYNAVDVDTFQKNAERRAKVREELGIQKDALVVGHVARLCYQKNQGYLLRVMAELVKLQPQALLLVVGDGELRGQLESQAKELGIWDNVRFLGVRQDVSSLLQAMDVFVLTSHYEGLPVSAVEAQASGVPCVLSTAVSEQTDISGLVAYVALESGYRAWAEKIVEQSRVRTDNVKEKIIENGYEIRTAGMGLYKAFLQED
ncbi:MAG: glycosyltransferase [Clostridia bacterium]|nr:glycosyltransferase [Clostridia bacterium]